MRVGGRSRCMQQNIRRNRAKLTDVRARRHGAAHAHLPNGRAPAASPATTTAHLPDVRAPAASTGIPSERLRSRQGTRTPTIHARVAPRAELAFAESERNLVERGRPRAESPSTARTRSTVNRREPRPESASRTKRSDCGSGRGSQASRPTPPRQHARTEDNASLLRLRRPQRDVDFHVLAAAPQLDLHHVARLVRAQLGHHGAGGLDGLAVP